MAKILVVTPTEQMEKQCRQLVSKAQLDAKVIRASSQTVVQQVRREQEQGVCVVVARGNHVRLLRKHMDIPVAEIVAIGQDLAAMLDEAKKLSGKEKPRIALLGFRYMFSDPTPIAQIVGCDAVIYYAGPDLDIESVTDHAIDEGADVVVGGELATRRARERGIPTLFLTSSDGSLTGALSEAKRILHGIELQQREVRQLSLLLNYSFDAILRTDVAGTVTMVNYMAEKLLRRKSSDLTGRKIHEILQLQEDSQILRAFREKKNVYSSVVRFKQQAFIANLAYINSDAETDGFLLSLQEFKRIDEMEETIRIDRYSHGYMAKAVFSEMTTRSPLMKELFDDAQQYSQYDLPIIITGPFGAETMRLAECIHNSSLRQKSPFVCADMAIMSAEMQQIQLMGAGLKGQGKNLFELAHTGTLVLENIDMLSRQGQYQLLAALRSSCIMQHDGSRVIPVNIRLICTTSKDLYLLVQKGQFLEQLYAYISQLELIVPCLHDHAEDIPDLLQVFLDEFAGKYRKFLTFTPEAQALIHAHPWNGDVLQLKLFCEKLTLLARDKTVDAAFVRKHLPHTFRARQEEMPKDEPKVAPVLYSKQAAELNAAIDQVGTNRSELAAYLGISKTTLWRKMKKFGLV